VNVRWSESAADQLVNIFEYIALDNADAAARTVQRIHAAIDRIATMPYSGRKGQKVGTREIVVAGTPYIVVYAILEDILYLVTILHGARDWPKSH
jgi:toxin ParE1/3/4